MQLAPAAEVGDQEPPAIEGHGVDEVGVRGDRPARPVGGELLDATAGVEASAAQLAPLDGLVHPAEGVLSGRLDPQGEAIRHALGTLGFDSVTGVRQGKVIELELDETDAGAAKAQAEKMCEALLANTVIERYEVEVL